MGATNVKYTIDGYSAKEVFNELKDKYIEEYGNNGYTGTIASCQMGYVDSLNGIFTKKREKEINEKIRRDFEENYLEKGVLNVIDCGIISYDVFEVKIEKSKNKLPKFKLMYCIKEYDKVLYKSENQKLAFENLLKLAIDYPNAILVKEYQLIEGDNIIAKPNIFIKEYKTRPKKIANGKVLKEKHRYIIYGFAPE